MVSDARPFTKWLFFIALLGMGVFALVFFISQGRTSAKVDDLRSEVSRLKRAGSPELVVREIRTERLVPVPTELPAAQASSAAALAAPPEPTPEQAEHHLAVVNEARLQTCRDTYAREARDPGWSRSAEQTLQKNLATDEFRPLRVAVECRATLCRVDLSYTDLESRALALKALQHVHSWPGQAFAELSPELKTASSYVAREGFELPQPELAALEE